MTRRSTGRVSVVVLLGLFALHRPALADVDIIVIDKPVVDTVGAVSAEGMDALEQSLITLRTETRVHMAALLIKTTGGLPIEDYAHQQAEAWGGGDAGVDQGVLLVIAIDDRRMRLEVGYGLETELTDALSRRILDLAKPYLRSGDYAAAMAAIIGGVSSTVRGIALPVAQARPVARRSGADNSTLRRPRVDFMLVVVGGGILLGILGYVALSRRRWRRIKPWRRRAVVWGCATAISALIALFAPAGSFVSAVLGLIGMMPFGYVLGRGPRGSKVGTVIIGGLLLGIATLGYLLALEGRESLSPWIYAAIPPGLLFIGFVGSAGLMAGSVGLLLIALPIGALEAWIRRCDFADSVAIGFCFWLHGSVIKSLAGDPKAEWSSGGTYSYSSSSGSSSYSYSSSSSSSSGYSSSSSYSSSSASSWSGGGGSFGGGGASSSW